MRAGSRETSRPYLSMLILAAVVLAVLTGRLFKLQILEGDYYRELSSRNHIRSVITPAPRGIISDRNGVILADNNPAFTVSLISAEFDTSSSELLRGLLDLPPEIFQERLNAAAAVPFRATIVSEGLMVEQVGRIADNLYRLGGVSVTVLPVRRYPHGESFCHLVGYTGLSDSVGVYHGEITGRTGLERILNDRLSGSHGMLREVVDAHGRVVERFEESSIEPVPGEPVRLTIDSRIQFAADSLIRATGHPGAFVAIDYTTGELLVLSSVPGYDTNLFTGGISGEDWNGILSSPERPLLNRSWATMYPPGSVYKTVSAAWLLERNIVDRDYMPDPCYRTYHYAGMDFNCWKAHGRLDLIEAISQSCDSYFYRTSMRGDMDDLAAFSQTFGMGGTLTGILPAEASGVTPTREYLNRVFGQGGWGTGNLMIASIGQGEVLATPLQIAVTSALIASSFEMPPVTLVAGEDFGARAWRRSVSEENLDIVREGMRRAVESRSGTLFRPLSNMPVTVHAKSGTAETTTGDDHAWVTGYISEPLPVAFAVIIENGGSGSETAGPVARDMIRIFIEVYDEDR